MALSNYGQFLYVLDSSGAATVSVFAGGQNGDLSSLPGIIGLPATRGNCRSTRATGSEGENEMEIGKLGVFCFMGAMPTPGRRRRRLYTHQIPRLS